MKMGVRERLKRVSRINRLGAKFAQTEAEQEGVENFYKKKFKLSKRDVQNLHMFFSPLIVQRGLTKLQVRFCINLYKNAGDDKTRDKRVILMLEAALKSAPGFFGEVLKNVLKRKIWAQKEISKLQAPSLS
jgi:hypothetical protein